MSKKLYSIELSDRFVVVVKDGEDPLKTFLTHCPDSIDVEHLPGFWDEDWPEDMPESEIFDRLLKNVVVEEFSGLYELDTEYAYDHGLLPEDFDPDKDWCSGVRVSAEELLQRFDHGEMWSERWAD